MPLPAHRAIRSAALLHAAAGAALAQPCEVEVPFGPAEVVLVNAAPRVFDLADLDADGDLDLCVADGGTLRVLQNDGTGTLLPWLEIVDPFGAGSVIDALRCGDLDGAGGPEVLIAGQHFQEVRSIVFRNDLAGGGGLLPGPAFAPEGAPREIELGDLDGDGDLDVLVTLGLGLDGRIAVVRNESSPGTIAFAEPAIVETDLQPQDATLVDLDGDGMLDVAFAGSDPDIERTDVGICFNGGSGTLSLPIESEFGVSNGYRSFIEHADVDRDGDQDLVVGFGVGFPTILRNLGGQRFEAGPLLEPALYRTGMLVADFDGDGLPDVLTTGNSGTELYAGLGDGTFAAGVPQGFVVARAVAGDVDGDGSLDVVSGAVNVALHRGSCGPAPVVVQQPPTAIAAPAGGSVEIVAAIETDPAVELRWHRDGVPLASGGRISGAEGPALVVDELVGADAGVYQLVLTRDSGSTTTTPTLLAVTDLATCPGDLDGNGVVDLADLTAVLTFFGGPCP